MTMTASDLRASDFFIGLLVAVVMLIGAGVLVTTIGPHGEAVAAVPDDREVVAVRPVEARAGARKAAPKKKATPRVQPLEPARTVEPRVRPQPKRAPATTPASRPRPEPESESESESDSESEAESESESGEAWVNDYRNTLRRWLASRVHIHDTGLEPDALDGKRVRLKLEIDHARTIIHASIVPTGTVAFDRAALAAVDSIRGETLPAPPVGYPGPLQRRIPIVFVCKPGVCR